MSWLDTLLAIGSTFDWITPAAAALDGRDDIIADIPPGMSADDVIRELRRGGVRANLPQVTDGGDRAVIAVDNVTKARRILRRL